MFCLFRHLTQTQRQARMKNINIFRIFQIPNKKHMFVKNVILRVWLDRGRQCGHFAPRTLSKSLFILFCLFTYVVFHIFSGFFDLTGTFQVQPLSGKGWWYVYNFDWYPKCPKWSALSRNVSILVRKLIMCQFLWFRYLCSAPFIRAYL